jgi:hypothetical protein
MEDHFHFNLIGTCTDGHHHALECNNNSAYYIFECYKCLKHFAFVFYCVVDKVFVQFLQLKPKNVDLVKVVKCFDCGFI